MRLAAQWTDSYPEAEFWFIWSDKLGFPEYPTVYITLTVMTKVASIPPDEDHLLHLSRCQATLLLQETKQMDPTEPVLQVLSVSLSALYQAATCSRGCHGGPHVLEALLGRAYNLVVGAWALIQVAQYDEALNLVRGIGEINNLLVLFAFEPALIPQWLSSTKKERMREFGPANIRKRLSKHASCQLIGDDWYSELCERFVHVHPGTQPNKHDSNLTGQIGPVRQERGAAHAVGELLTVAFAVALSACRWFKFDDTLAKLGNLIEAVPVRDGASKTVNKPLHPTAFGVG